MATSSARFPRLAGRKELDNLLRMLVVAERFSGGASDASINTLRAEFEAHRTVEIGGYEVSSRLAAEIDSKQILPLIEGFKHELAWLDVGAEESETLSPVRQNVIDALPRDTIVSSRGAWRPLLEFGRDHDVLVTNKRQNSASVGSLSWYAERVSPGLLI